MTIYDIAREAGVSASTVSRVINDKPGVRKATREKVRALLNQYRYRPNEAARELVTNSSRMVGILVADLRQPHHIASTYHIVQELARYGYCGLVFNGGMSESERVAGLELFAQRSVEAAVLMGSIFQTRTVKNAIERCLPGVPVFMLNGFVDLPNVYGVLADDRAGMRDCVRLLARKGRRSIVFLADQPTPSSALKTKGFEDGVREMGVHPLIYRSIDNSFDGGYQMTLRILREHPELDALVCGQDLIACGALRALRERGLRVPQDVAVIGVDNTDYAEICTPRLTSLNTMAFDSGVLIAHKLIDCLEGRGTNHRTLLFPGIVEREST